MPTHTNVKRIIGGVHDMMVREGIVVMIKKREHERFNEDEGLKKFSRCYKYTHRGFLFYIFEWRFSEQQI